MGSAFNTVGVYFYFRSVIKYFEDIDIVLKIIAVVAIPISIAMLIEWKTGKNLFAFLGGVPELSEIRDDRIRSQGSFQHPILAGTFGATLMPLFVPLWFRNGRMKFFGSLGLAVMTIIPVTSSSSGPAMAYMFGLAGLLMW